MEIDNVAPLIVEAYTASWIEIPLSEELESLLPVEAYTASWIEITGKTVYGFHAISRSLYGFVD